MSLKGIGRKKSTFLPVKKFVLTPKSDAKFVLDYILNQSRNTNA